MVRHANLRLHVEQDPYGAASWWLTSTDLLAELAEADYQKLTILDVEAPVDITKARALSIRIWLTIWKRCFGRLRHADASAVIVTVTSRTM